MTGLKVTEELVKEVGQNLVREVDLEFSAAEARFATRRELGGGSNLEAQGFPAPDLDFHVLLVPPASSPDVGAFATNRAAETWEEEGVKIRTKVFNRSSAPR